MKVKDKKALYESIMMNVSKMVKKDINEYGDGIDAEDEMKRLKSEEPQEPKPRFDVEVNADGEENSEEPR